MMDFMCGLRGLDLRRALVKTLTLESEKAETSRPRLDIVVLIAERWFVIPAYEMFKYSRKASSR